MFIREMFMKKLMLILALALVAVPMFAVTAGADGFRPSRWVCFARNHRGITFEAVAFERRHAEREALEKCYRHGSRTCRPDGCRTRW